MSGNRARWLEAQRSLWVFRGTRVPVQALFENLDEGATVDDFLAWFSGVSREQIDEALMFASSSLATA